MAFEQVKKVGKRSDNICACITCVLLLIFGGVILSLAGTQSTECGRKKFYASGAEIMVFSIWWLCGVALFKRILEKDKAKEIRQGQELILPL